MKLNIGCGDYPLQGFVNIDADPAAKADVYCSVPPLPYADASVDEIYAGHFLEHLTHDDAAAFLRECHRVLKPCGKIGIVVPDTRAVMAVYLGQLPLVCEYPQHTFHDCRNLDDVCRLFLYSTVQPSRHLWSYDLTTLARVMSGAGFEIMNEINRQADPRIPCGAWYQCGLDAVKAAA